MPRRDLRGWLVPVAALAAVAAAVWPAMVLGRVFGGRLAIPADLEWQEGLSMEEAFRTVHTGAPVYGDPALGWQSQIYTPLYFAVVGAVGRVFGLDYGTGRAVSAIAFAVTCACVARVVARHARYRGEGLVLGAVAAGMVCVAFSLTGGWFDLVRVDSLAIALIVGAATCLGGPAPGAGAGRAACAGLLCVLAVYTKQTSLAFAPWLGVFALVRRRRAGLAFAGTLAATGGAAWIALQVATSGWFWFWVTLPEHQRVDLAQLGPSVRRLLLFAPYLAAAPLLAPILIGKRWATATTALWWGLLASSVPAGLLALLKVGGASNNYLPIVCVAPPAAMLTALDLLDGPARDRPWRPLSLAGLLGSAALYLASRWVDVATYVPSARVQASLHALGGFVAALPGGVIIPSHPFLARRAEPNTPQLMMMGYAELHWATEGAGAPPRHAGRPVLADLGADVARIDPEWIVLSDVEAWMVDRIAARYRLWCRVEPPAMAFNVPDAALHYVYRRRSPGRDASAPFLGVPPWMPAAPVCSMADPERPTPAPFAAELRGGFLAPEGRGCPLWASGPMSGIALQLPEASPVHVVLSVEASPATGSPVRLRANGSLDLGGAVPEAGRDLVVDFPGAAGLNLLTFEPSQWNHHPDAIAPSDPRPLAFAARRVTVSSGPATRVLFP